MNEQENVEVWYYVLKGQRNGPVPMDEIEALIKNGTIRPETKVWHAGMGSEWQVARDTALAGLLANNPLPPEPPPTEPPPLEPPPLSESHQGQSKSSAHLNAGLSSVSEQGKRVLDEINAFTVTTTEDGKTIDDRLIWGMIVLAFLIALLELIIRVDLRAVSGILTLVACFIDWRKLKGDGFAVPAGGWILLTPFYLWKRAELLNQKKHYLTAWIGVLIVSVAMMLSSPGNAQIEAAACSLVSDIFKKQLHQNTTCKRLTIIKDLRDGDYLGKAKLSNGREIDVSIQTGKDGNIYVEI